jgi:hypothetical protein
MTLQDPQTFSAARTLAEKFTAWSHVFGVTASEALLAKLARLEHTDPQQLLAEVQRELAQREASVLVEGLETPARIGPGARVAISNGATVFEVTDRWSKDLAGKGLLSRDQLLQIVARAQQLLAEVQRELALALVEENVLEQPPRATAGQESIAAAAVPPPTRARATKGGPRLAAYLEREMRERRLTRDRLEKDGGPHSDTIKKLLAGEKVTANTIDRLAQGLGVDPTEIPTD